MDEIIIVGGGFVVVGGGFVVVVVVLLLGTFAFRRTGGGGAGMVGIVIGIVVCRIGTPVLVERLGRKGDFLEKGEGIGMLEEQAEIVWIGAVVAEKRADGFGHMADRLAFKELEEMGAGVGNIVEVDVEFVAVALGKGEEEKRGFLVLEGVNGNGIRVAKKRLVLVEEDVEGWRQIGKNIEGLALGEGGDSHVAAEEGEIAEGGPFLSQRVERVVEMNRIWG